MDLDSALTGKPAEGASAIKLLSADHREIRALLADYDNHGGSAHVRKVSAEALFVQLELHDRIEREILYPAVKKLGVGDVDAMFDAHDAVIALVCSLRDRTDWNAEADPAMSRLGGLIEAHVTAEEEKLFPSMQKAGDAWLAETGAAIVRLKEELTRSTQEFENPAT